MNKKLKSYKFISGDETIWIDARNRKHAKIIAEYIRLKTEKEQNKSKPNEREQSKSSQKKFRLFGKN